MSTRSTSNCGDRDCRDVRTCCEAAHQELWGTGIDPPNATAAYNCGSSAYGSPSRRRAAVRWGKCRQHAQLGGGERRVIKREARVTRSGRPAYYKRSNVARQPTKVLQTNRRVAPRTVPKVRTNATRYRQVIHARQPNVVTQHPPQEEIQYGHGTLRGRWEPRVAGAKATRWCKTWRIKHRSGANRGGGGVNWGPTIDQSGNKWQTYWGIQSNGRRNVQLRAQQRQQAHPATARLRQRGGGVRAWELQ